MSLAYGMLAAGLTGFAVSLFLRARLPRALQVLGYWFAADAAFTTASLFAAKWYRNSRVTSNCSNLVSVCLAMEALGRMQGARKSLVRFRVAAACYAVAWVVLMLTAENPTEYSKYSGPLMGCILVAAGALTIARRVSVARAELLHDPSFLVGVAFVAYEVPTAFLTTVAQLLLRDHPADVLYYSAARFGVTIPAMFLMIYAMVLYGRQARLRSA